jgi:hypothetical protein
VKHCLAKDTAREAMESVPMPKMPTGSTGGRNNDREMVLSMRSGAVEWSGWGAYW